MIRETKKLSSGVQAVLPVNQHVYKKLRKLLVHHGFEDQVYIDVSVGEEVLDLQGIALSIKTAESKEPRRKKVCGKREEETPESKGLTG